MLQILHLAAALALLAAHGTFLGRGLYLRRAGKGPAALDRVTRTLSQLLLPLTAAIGLVGRHAPASGARLSHLLSGLAPLAAILVVSAGRLALRRRTAAPWLLPAINLALIAAAMVTGFAAAGG